MYCPVCYEEVISDATICRFCGALLPETTISSVPKTATRHCPTCYEINPVDAHFCMHCGAVPHQVATGETIRLSADAPPVGPMTQPLTLQCSKCHGQMEHGFIPESTRDCHHGLVWISGDAERSKWSGNINVAGRRMWVLRSYRCSVCGYVELYAREEVGPRA